MDGFHYVDIFATKGIEYIVVIAFLLFLIPFWVPLNKPLKNAIRAGRKEFASVRRWFTFVEGLYYHQGHSWALPVGDNRVRVGIDDFAQKLLGTPQAIVLPRIGDKLTQGDKGWRLKVDSKEIDILSPISGKVVRVNNNVLARPASLNQNPYEDGWLLEIEAPKLTANLKNLVSGKLAKDWMRETVAALQEKMHGELGMVMQDGGGISSGFAKSISPDHWDEIAAEFLHTKS